MNLLSILFAGYKFIDNAANPTITEMKNTFPLVLWNLDTGLPADTTNLVTGGLNRVIRSQTPDYFYAMSNTYGHNFPFPFRNDYSFACRLKPILAGNWTVYPFALTMNSVGIGGWRIIASIAINIDLSFTIEFKGSVPSGITNYIITSTAPLSTLAYQWVIVNIDQATPANSKVYLDGVDVTDTITPYVDYEVDEEDSFLKVCESAGDYYGVPSTSESVDELYFFTRQLTPGEIVIITGDTPIDTDTDLDLLPDDADIFLAVEKP